MTLPANTASAPIKLTTKQANIFQWGWQAAARFRDAVNGRRFGKTYLAAAEIRRAARLAALWGVSTDDEIWYAAPTFKQAKRVFWRRLKKSIPREWMDGKPNESECFITLRSGHIIRIVGLDAYDNLRGSGLFFLVIDEWADCPWESWEETLQPMLATCKYTRPDGVEDCGGHVLRIGTPKGRNHCYDTWREGQPGALHVDGCMSWQYTSVQGGNIPAAEIERARRTMDPRAFRQELEASFETYDGIIYYAFDRELNSSTEVVRPGDSLIVGMDFNVRKMAAVIYVMRGGILHAVDEITNGLDTPWMADTLKQQYPGHQITIYPDASGNNSSSKRASESDVSILRGAGLKVVVGNANPLVKDRVSAVNAMCCNAAGQRRLMVNLDRCPSLLKTLERQIYDDRGEPDKKAGLDHVGDAAGYPIAALFPVKFYTNGRQPLRM